MIIPDRWLRRLHLFVCDVGHTSDEMPQFEQRGSRNRERHSAQLRTSWKWSCRRNQSGNCCI